MWPLDTCASRVLVRVLSSLHDPVRAAHRSAIIVALVF